MVEVKKISEKNNVLKLLVTDTDTVMINSIRRAAMGEVQTLAVEDVSIYENTSIIPDEMLAHRLSMLPIKMDMKRYKEGDTLKLLLEKEGPCTVYGKDIKSTDPKIDVIDKKVPIAKLKKDQKIKIEMEATIGRGKDHAKWQTAIIGYKNVADIATEKECNLCKDCIHACPKKILEVKGKTISLKEPLQCDLCGECRDACKVSQLKIKENEKAFLLTIETMKSLENTAIIEEAINKLEQKTGEFRKALKDL